MQKLISNKGIQLKSGTKVVKSESAEVASRLRIKRKEKFQIEKKKEQKWNTKKKI